MTLKSLEKEMNLLLLLIGGYGNYPTYHVIHPAMSNSEFCVNTEQVRKILRVLF